MKIDLNCDLGEGFGAYRLGADADMMDIATSVNIACGFHAGDYRIMQEMVKMAKTKNVAIGAHPGFPDLQGFGRRFMDMTPDDIYALIVYQVGALQGFCQTSGVRLNHVKPHGALYNAASKKKTIATAIAHAVRDIDDGLILYGLSGGELITAGEQAGLQTAREGFCDRTYLSDESLTPRKMDGAVITDVEAAVEQVSGMIFNDEVVARDGSVIDIQADTICIHGDNPSAVTFARELSEILRRDGVMLERIL